MPPIIDDEKCTKWGSCVEVCPVDVYFGSEDGESPSISLGEDCFFCGSCILECRPNAITLRYPLYSQASYLTDS